MHRNLTVFALALSALSLHAQRRGGFGGPVDAFRFRFVGPRVGNRVSAIAGVPGDPSTPITRAPLPAAFGNPPDGGNDWTPIFDNEPVAAIGALAVAPSDPNVVWAGTGRSLGHPRFDVMGDGIYQSTDAGKTWAAHGSGRDRPHRPNRCPSARIPILCSPARWGA